MGNVKTIKWKFNEGEEVKVNSLENTSKISFIGVPYDIIVGNTYKIIGKRYSFGFYYYKLLDTPSSYVVEKDLENI